MRLESFRSYVWVLSSSWYTFCIPVTWFLLKDNLVKYLVHWIERRPLSVFRLSDQCAFLSSRFEKHTTIGTAKLLTHFPVRANIALQGIHCQISIWWSKVCDRVCLTDCTDKRTKVSRRSVSTLSLKQSNQHGSLQDTHYAGGF